MRTDGFRRQLCSRIARCRQLIPSPDVFHLGFHAHIGQHTLRVKREKRIDAGIALRRAIQSAGEGAVELVNIGEIAVQPPQFRRFATEEATDKVRRDDSKHRLCPGGEGPVHPFVK